MYDKMFGLNKQKIIVYDTPGFGDSDMGKVSNEIIVENFVFSLRLSKKIEISTKEKLNGINYLSQVQLISQ